MKSNVTIRHSLFALISAGLLVLSLTACETTKGVGKDIQNAGEAMEDAVE